MMHERIFYVKIPFPIDRRHFGHHEFISFGRRHYLADRTRHDGNHAETRSTEEVVAQLSRGLDQEEEDKDDEWYIEQPRQQHSSIVSLNRQPHISLSAIRESKHRYQDARGNLVNVQLHVAKSKIE